MSAEYSDDDEKAAREWLSGNTGAIYLTQMAREKLLPSLARLVARSREMGEFDCKAHANLLSLQRDQLNCSCNYDRSGLCLWHSRRIEEQIAAARDAALEEAAQFADSVATHDVRCKPGRCLCASEAGQIAESMRAIKGQGRGHAKLAPVAG